MSTPVTPSANPLPGSTAEAAPGLSEGQRLINVFIAPSKTFTDLKRRANWFVPWLLLVIAGYAFVGVIAQKIGFRQITENQIRMSPKAQEKMAEMPAEQRGTVMGYRIMGVKIGSFGFPVFALVIYLIVAAVLMATFNFGIGAEVPFGPSLAIVIYARLPEIIMLLLAIVALFAGADPDSFNLDNPVASNLGFLADVSAQPALYKLASAFDIFSIWVIVLTGIGFSCVSKVKQSTAIGAVFAWYALKTLVVVGIAAVFA